MDYLGHWLDRARTAWLSLGKTSLPALDLLTHSTGGLLARAYIESPAYGATYAGGTKTLPEIFNFIESAGPTPLPVLRELESVSVPGLFFLGLEGARNFQSRFLRGIRRDAAFLSDKLEQRLRAA